MRGVLSAANTELTGLPVSIFFERQESFQTEAMLST